MAYTTLYICVTPTNNMWFYYELLTLPYLNSGVDRLLHLPSAEAVSAQPNARPRM